MNGTDEDTMDTTRTSAARLTRRDMLKRSSIGLAALGAAGGLGFTTARASDATQSVKTYLPLVTDGSGAKPRIVLVHGAWADGTSWQELIPWLEDAGYPVIAVQNPLTSVADDVATTKRVIDAEAKLGPVVVVGHSYGGVVITAAAAGNANVKALVYIAAFAPEENVPLGAILADYPTELGTALVPDEAGFVYIDRAKFRGIFAPDVAPATAYMMGATQKPINGHIFGETVSAAAWRTIPAWYMVAANDRTLAPTMQRFLAQRMKATTVEIASSHVAYISHPADVFALIETAAQAVM